jgi:hypothetical protein
MHEVGAGIGPVRKKSKRERKIGIGRGNSPSGAPENPVAGVNIAIYHQ